MDERRGSLTRPNFPGSNVQFGMRHSLEAVPNQFPKQDRLERLKNEFAEIDANGDKVLTFEEVHAFLSKKTGKEFDRELCQRLFDRLDKNKDKVITKEEFILGYVDAETAHQLRADELKMQIQDSTLQMENARKKMLTASSTEQLNSYGIMKGSVLTVNVVKAQGLKPDKEGKLSNPFVVLTCEDQRIETRPINKTLNPVWEETFTFQIQEGTEDLHIAVMSQSSLNQHEFEGQVSIPLQSISNQMKHDQFFDLHGQNQDDVGQGKIHLTLQWIWSKTKYWEILANQWKESIEVDTLDLKAIQGQLAKLQEPFIFFNDNLESKDYQRFNSYSGPINSSEGASTGFNSYAEAHDVIEWGKSVQFFFAIFVSLTLVSMLLRSDFVNLTLALLISEYMFNQRLTAGTSKTLSKAVILSEVLDIVWLLLFFSVSPSQRETDPDENHLQSTVVLIASVANFLLKLPVAMKLSQFRHL